MTTSDESERLLSKYLKAQVPHPWPSCRALDRPTEPAGLMASASPGQIRNRLTLAVSFAALLGFGLLLSGRPEPHPAPPTEATTASGLLDSATAKGKGLERKGSVTVDPERKRP